jgi:hypothetical protein
MKTFVTGDFRRSIESRAVYSAQSSAGLNLKGGLHDVTYRILIAKYLEWQGYLIRRNTRVGRLGHGGWAMELDVVGFDPHSGDLVHYELSIARNESGMFSFQAKLKRRPDSPPLVV